MLCFVGYIRLCKGVPVAICDAKVSSILKDSGASAKIISNQTLILFTLKSRKGFQEIIL